MFRVYILSCSDGTYHSGTTTDVDKRVAYHQNGENPETFTYSRRPVRLIFEKAFNDIRVALDFEKQIKELSEEELTELISGKRTIAIAQFKSEKSIPSKKTKLILPATYLGNINYYKSVQGSTELIIDAGEVFQKQSYRSRCTILSANGIQNLVVPVIRPNGKKTRTSEALISYAENWRKDHLKAIESAYRKAPFYAHYADDLVTIIEEKHARLLDLNIALTEFLIGALNLNCTVRLGTAEETAELQNKMLVEPKQQDLSGKFKTYQQVFGADRFVPNLSVLDCLFNVGRW